ncbi:hypothetical protein ACKFKG_30600 [Phormidesmis sp. 146-35]
MNQCRGWQELHPLTISGQPLSATVEACFVRNYRDRLSPWCITQHLPKMQRIVVVRFRRRNDAREYLRVLNQLNETAIYEIVWLS